MSSVEGSAKMFQGHSGEDVRRFIFAYENVIARGKEDVDKALDIVVYLGEVPFASYYDRFTQDGELIDDANDYKIVREWLLSTFGKKLDLDEIIRQGVEARVDFNRLGESVAEIDNLYRKAGFNEEAKFGLLRKAVTQHRGLARFVLLKGPTTYETLREAISSYVKANDNYPQEYSQDATTTYPQNANNKKKVTILKPQNIHQGQENSSSRPNELKEMENRMESRMEDLSEMMSNLHLVIKKSHTTPKSGNPGKKLEDITCSFCNETGHYANKCPKNPHRNTKCTRCGKQGHTESSCWVRNVSASTLKGAKSESKSETDKVNYKTNNGAGSSNAGPVSIIQVTGRDHPFDMNPVTTTKRGHDGEIISKRMRDNDGNIVTRIQGVDTHYPQKVSSQTTKAIKKKKNKKNSRRSLKEIYSYGKKYDVIQDILDKPSGMTYGQILSGQAEEARKKLRKVFPTSGKGQVLATPAAAEPERLKLIPVTISGVETQALLDSGAIPNLISVALVQELGITVYGTSKTITVADGTSSECIGIVRNVRISIGEITKPMEFMVVQEPPVAVIIGSPMMETLNTKIDLGKRSVKMSYKGRKVHLGLDYESFKTATTEGETDSEDFTSDDSSSDDSIGGYQSDEEETDPGDKESDEEKLFVSMSETDHARDEDKREGNQPGFGYVCTILAGPTIKNQVSDEYQPGEEELEYDSALDESWYESSDDEADDPMDHSQPAAESAEGKEEVAKETQAVEMELERCTDSRKERFDAQYSFQEKERLVVDFYDKNNYENNGNQALEFSLDLKTLEDQCKEAYHYIPIDESSSEDQRNMPESREITPEDSGLPLDFESIPEELSLADETECDKMMEEYYDKEERTEPRIDTESEGTTTEVESLTEDDGEWSDSEDSQWERYRDAYEYAAIRAFANAGMEPSDSEESEGNSISYETSLDLAQDWYDMEQLTNTSQDESISRLMDELTRWGTEEDPIIEKDPSEGCNSPKIVCSVTDHNGEYDILKENPTTGQSETNEIGHDEEPITKEVEDERNAAYLPGADIPEPAETNEIERLGLMSAKLVHIDEPYQENLFNTLLDLEIMAWDLQELRPALVPVEHLFELKEHRPIFHRSRRLSPRDMKIVEEEVEKMLAGGVITPVASEWGFPVVIVRKKDGNPRFCIDFRKLNARMKSDKYPLPNMEEILEEMNGNRFFTTLDLFSGYWQIPMSADLKDVVTFVCHMGAFRFEVMPFGLKNAPATFQKMMSSLLRNVPFARVYLDDIVIFSKTAEEHMKHVTIVLTIIANAHLKIKMKKCFFFQEKVELLGHFISATGIEVDPAKVEKVKNAPVPTDKTQLRSFLGLCSYYRRFVKGFASIAAPLHAVTTPKGNFTWTDEMQRAFEDLKNRLCSPPIIAFPDFDTPFIVETDASSVGLGAVLAQKDEKGAVHPIQFASRTLRAAEKNYTVSEKEALAVIFALKKFRVYLLSDKEFTLFTDHQALKYAFTKPDVHGRFARWLDFLAEYNFKIEYKPGEENGPADFLSRLMYGEKEQSQPKLNQVCVVGPETVDAKRDYEKEIVGMIQFLTLKDISSVENDVRKWVKSNASNFFITKDGLFRRTAQGIRVVPDIPLRSKIMRTYHDEIGHWDVETTKQFIFERFWWPKGYKEITDYVRGCHDCQLFSPVPSYRTTKHIPITSLFETFSIDFAGPLEKTKSGNVYIIIAVEHLTNWPIACATPNSTSEEVLKFVRKEIVNQFGPPRSIISDNGTSFTSGAVQTYARKMGINWKTTLAYAPMSNGRAERMVGTLKNGIKKTINGKSVQWDKALEKVLFGYRRRKNSSGFSPFELLYGQTPRLLNSDHKFVETAETPEAREVQIASVAGIRTLRQQERPATEDKEEQKVRKYKVGEKVLVAHGPSLNRAVKWPALKPKYFGPCTITKEKHPRYEMVSSTGKVTRSAIHARRLKPYREQKSEVAMPVTTLRKPIPVDYLQFVVGRRTIGAWLQPIYPSQVTQRYTAYNLLHLCISFYLAKGPLMTKKKWITFEHLIDSYDPLVRTELRDTEGNNFLHLLYHFTVGRFGLLSHEETFFEEVLNKVDWLESVLEGTMISEDSATQPFEFYYRPNHKILPCPYTEGIFYEDDQEIPELIENTACNTISPQIVCMATRSRSRGVLQQDYLEHIVLGKRLRTWLAELTYNAPIVLRQIWAYHLIHFSLNTRNTYGETWGDAHETHMNALLYYFNNDLYTGIIQCEGPFLKSLFYVCIGAYGHVGRQFTKDAGINYYLEAIAQEIQQRGPESAVLIRIDLKPFTATDTAYHPILWPYTDPSDPGPSTGTSEGGPSSEPDTSWETSQGGNEPVMFTSLGRSTNRSPALPVSEANGHVAVIDILQFIVGQKTLGTWLESYTPSTARKRIIAYNLLHMAVSFSLARGPMLSELDMELYLDLVQCYDSDLLHSVGIGLVKLIYFFAVGRYGELDPDQTFYEEVSAKIQWLEDRQRGYNRTQDPLPGGLDQLHRPNHSIIPQPSPDTAEDQTTNFVMALTNTGGRATRLRHSYLNLLVNGRNLRDWFSHAGHEIKHYEQQVWAYHMIHFCLTYYKFHGETWTTPISNAIYTLVYYFDKRLHQWLSNNITFLPAFYHMVIGAYGYVSMYDTKAGLVHYYIRVISEMAKDGNHDQASNSCRIDLHPECETQAHPIPWPFSRDEPRVQYRTTSTSRSQSSAFPSPGGSV